MDQSIRKRKVPLQEPDHARILANFKKATEKWSGKTFKHFEYEELQKHLEQVRQAKKDGVPF